MYQIGIITSNINQDWASRELLTAARTLADGDIIDPLTFEINIDDGTPLTRVHGRSADEYDAYIIRGFNTQGEIDYQYEVFELLEQRGKLVINSPAGISAAESKSQTTFLLRQAGLPVPRTVVTQNLDQAITAMHAFGTAVIKPLYGSHGIGIERLEAGTDDELLQAFLDKYSVIYIQEFVPNEGRDIRAFVVGDDVSAAVYRIARDGQWKTNVFLGGSCEPCELTPEIRELCISAVKVIGLDYTGVDVMEGPDGPVILELNGTASWHGLSKVTNRNIAMDIVCHALRMLDTGRSARQPVGFRHP